MKKIISFLICSALIASLFLCIPATASAATVEDDNFVAENYNIDFSNYRATASESFYSADNFTIKSDASAEGGKYLSYKFTASRSESRRTYFALSETGLPKTGTTGVGTDYIKLTDGAAYNVTVKYKLDDFTTTAGVLSLMLKPSNNTKDIVNDTDTSSSVLLETFNASTSGWVTKTYTVTIPAGFSDKDSDILHMQILPAKSAAPTTWVASLNLGSYTFNIDYVNIERLGDYIPQHMDVDFSGWSNVVSGENNAIYSSSSDISWAVAGDENKYLKMEHIGDVTYDRNYNFMINPTGKSSSGSPTVDYNSTEYYFLATGEAKYRVRFKYQLISDSDITVPVYLAWTNSYAKANNLQKYSTDFTRLSKTTDNDWAEFEFVFSTNVASDSIDHHGGLSFFKGGDASLSAVYTLNIDDISIDRVSEITMVNTNGSVSKVYGAPKSPNKNVLGFNGCEADILNFKNGSAEVYNGSLGIVSNSVWYEDSNLTVPVKDGRTFHPANEVIYANGETVINDENQVAFCGFDTFTKRSEAHSAGDYKAWQVAGWDKTYWSVSNEQAYTGAKSLHANIGTSYRYGYIGSGYEMIPGQSYLLSFYVKKDVAVANNADITFYVVGTGDIYGRCMWCNSKSLKADEFTGDWQKIEIPFTFTVDYDQVASRTFTEDFYYAPTLAIKTASGDAALWIDTVVLSSLCLNTGIQEIDDDSLRVTSDYQGADTVYLAGEEYDVNYRRVYSSLNKDATDLKENCVTDYDVMVEDKTGNFNECYAYDEDSNTRTFSSTITGITDNQTSVLNVRTSISVTSKDKSKTYVFYSKPIKKALSSETSTYIPSNSNYKLVWSDEFNGSELDTTKWSINTEKSVGGADYSIYEQDGVTVKSQKTLLTEQMDLGVMSFDGSAMVMKSVASNGAKGYSSPLGIWTKYTMNYRYGYIEARIDMPYQTTAPRALWFQSGWGELSGQRKCKVNSVELDMLEITNGHNGAMTPDYHLWYYDNSASVNRHLQYSASSKISGARVEYGNSTYTGYHIYGMEWTPEYVSIYVDGVKIATYDTTLGYTDIWGNNDGYENWSLKAFQDPFCILFGGTDSVVGRETKIDWIRLYQKNVTGEAYDGSAVHQDIWR